MGAVSKFVKRQPSWFQRAYYAAVPFAWRYGEEYRRMLADLRHSQWWDEGRLREYQQAQLAGLLAHAYENVPYYRAIFDERGLTPADIKGPEDLHLLPILTRADVRANADRMIATGYSTAGLVAFKTSGSTGAPLRFWGNDALYKREAAHVTRAYEAHGAKLYREKTIWLRRYVPNPGGPLFHHDRELRRLYLSAYDLNRETLPQYLDWMRDYGARVIVGYPSSLYILALLLRETGREAPRFNSAHAASEQMHAGWQKVIEDTLGCPVRMHYGMMEKVSLHFQCWAGDGYHEALEYGVTEIVDDRVVATGFLNWAMPFIRYDTGDRAIINAGSKRCVCDRELPVTIMGFEGRCDDILVIPAKAGTGGSYVPGVNFYTMMYKIQGVAMFQIVQDAPDHVEVRIVPGPDYRLHATPAQVRQGMAARMGEGVKIEVNVVDGLERSRVTGKIRAVECRCKTVV